MTTFKQLLKKYGPEELAESFVFPIKLSAEEYAESVRQLNEARKISRKAMTPEIILKGNLLQLRFKMEDYIKDTAYNPKTGFGYYLQCYLDILNIKNKDFAKAIGINATGLSQYINGHRKPNENILMRLEIQSNNIIPAILWYRLLQKGEEHRLLHDQKLRRRERSHVRSKVKT